MPTTTAASAFDQFVTYAGPIVQLLYWAALAFAAVLAAIQFKRLVDAGIAAMGARGREHGGAVHPAAVAADTDIDIDAFVE